MIDSNNAIYDCNLYPITESVWRMMAWRLRGSKTLPQCLTDDSDSDEEDLSNPKDYVDGVFMGFVKRPAMTVEKQYPDGDINMVRFTGTEKPVYGECPREFIITCQTR